MQKAEKRLAYVKLVFGFCNKETFSTLYYRKAEGQGFVDAMNQMIKKSGVSLSFEEAAILIEELKGSVDLLDLAIVNVKKKRNVLKKQREHV